MRECKNYELHNLPDIEMYGGDTTPWEITLIRDDGTRYSTDTASELTATLTLTPLKATTGIGDNVNIITPIFTKTGTLKPILDGGSSVIFTFSENDTKGLRGKFLYQIEVKRREDLRVCQGHIYIKQNINR